MGKVVDWVIFRSIYHTEHLMDHVILLCSIGDKCQLLTAPDNICVRFGKQRKQRMKQTSFGRKRDPNPHADNDPEPLSEPVARSPALSLLPEPVEG